MRNRWDQRRRRELAAQAGERVTQAQAVFDSIRDGLFDAASLPAQSGERDAFREAASRVLSRIQEHADYFEAVSALRTKILGYPKLEDYPALAEIMQIRRDLWAAADVALVEDLRELGEAFAEEGAYERFCAEAASLLFKRAPHLGDDPVDLRLALVGEEAALFASRLEEEMFAREQRDRLPTRAEMAARAEAVIQTVPRAWRAARSYSNAAVQGARNAARAVRESRSVNSGIRGARRLGAGAASVSRALPCQISAAAGKTSAATRDGAQKLKGHYEFLVEAYRLQERYEEALKKAPEVSAKGREFIARLELARRGQDLRRTAGRWAAQVRGSDYPGAALRGLERGRALVVSGVQTLQRRIRAE